VAKKSFDLFCTIIYILAFYIGKPLKSIKHSFCYFYRENRKNENQ